MAARVSARISMVVAAAVLTACSTPSADYVTATHPTLVQKARTEVEIADSYWGYAALAAEVYASRGLSEIMLAMPLPGAAVSDAQRQEVIDPSDEIQAMAGERAAGPQTLAGRFAELCPIHQLQLNGDTERLHRCEVLLPDEYARYKKLPEEKKLSFREDMQRQERQRQAIDALADSFKSCDVEEDATSRVPLSMVQRDLGWVKVREFEKYDVAKSWNVFVPELAIDVWRRPRPDRSPHAVEYALVYRGTAGPGGWVSNLQILTTMMPFVWHQYKQAVAATKKIVRQIYYRQMHEDTGRERASDVLITAIGHSLGAGLAEYSYYRVPQITKAIGFNPTPVDGSHSLIPVEDREGIVLSRAHTPRDHESWVTQLEPPYNDSAVLMLTERGEILGRLSSCVSGPLWGGEGGPSNLCETVNMAHGNPFKQHDIRPLACKLAYLHVYRARVPSSAAMADPAAVAR